MASSPPKRRKTSPVTSIPIENATPRPQRPTATDVPHTAPGRASFLSPTKASLARFNPGLLVRPQSAGGERSKGQEVVERPLDTSAVETPTTANGVWEEVANGHDNAPGAVVDAAQEVVEKRNGEKSPSPGVTIATPARTTRSMAKQGLRASPRRRSRTPAAVASPPPDRVREPLATMNETTQTVQDNRDPRSQLEGDREGQVLKAVQALAHLDGANDEQEPEELELPPTPSQLGLADPVVTKAPAGLLNTPSKRPRKNRALGEALKSSPVKTLPIRRSTISPTKNAAPRFTRRNLGSEAAGMRRRRQESPGVEGRADRDGALSPKRRKRDDLREQLRKLQDEVAMYEKQAESAREVSRDGGRPPIDLASEGDRENLM
ncbi:MAG: hypothetical protein M1839_007543 [Geoglossum umbratile]|nr:MAG: hypothetical protein M1839_007543 [Geoglossum umbratile]